MFNTKKPINKEIVVKEISIAVYAPAKIAKNVVVAYISSNVANMKFNYTILPIPKTGRCTRSDILEAIRVCESVDNVVYSYANGSDKNIYVCRALEGVVFDVIDRNGNMYIDGFSEIAQTNLPFNILDVDLLKREKAAKCECALQRSNSNVENGYDTDSFEYVLLNACNACLLGVAFDNDEFDIMSYNGRRIKIEVRTADNFNESENILNIQPRFDIKGYCSEYVTETFRLIGEDMTINSLKYALIFNLMLKSYRWQRRIAN